MTNYKQLFENYLDTWYQEGSLKESINYVIRNGGNRIRPQLVLAWCDVVGGNIYDALPVALAIECAHTASLIHDDLPCMDNSLERRGRPALHIQKGEDAAVLCGDLLLAQAFALISTSNFSDKDRIRMIQMLSTCAMDMVDGQYLELSKDNKDWNDWTKVHGKKTSSLIATACALGALAGGGNSKKVYEAYRFGYDVGIFYQILDDFKDKDGVSEFFNEAETKEFIYSHLPSIEGKDYPSLFLNQLAEAILQ